jgi:hypothetical protein
MGLFTGLLTLPLAPVRGVAWVVGQVVEEADRQLYDPAGIRRSLMALELECEEGLITIEERQAEEERLLERLQIAQARAAAVRAEATDG